MTIAPLDAVRGKEGVDKRLLGRFNYGGKERIDGRILLVEHHYAVGQRSGIMGNTLCRGKGDGQVAAAMAPVRPGTRQPEWDTPR